MMSRNSLFSRTILFVCMTLASSATTTTSTTVDKSKVIHSPTSYQLAPRQALRNPRRANEETLTFSGDVDKMIEMANNRARDRAEAAAAAAANDNTINVDINNNNNNNNVDGNNSDTETLDGTEGADGNEEVSVPILEAPTTPPKGIDDGSEHSENSDMTKTLCPTDNDSPVEVPSTIPVPLSDEVSSPAPVQVEPAPSTPAPAPAPVIISESIPILHEATKAPFVTTMAPVHVEPAPSTQAPVPAPAPAPVSVSESIPILHEATKAPFVTIIVTNAPTGYPAEDANEAIPSPSESPAIAASNPSTAIAPTVENISQESSGWYPIPAVTVTQAPASSPESVDLTPPTTPGGSELPVVTDENTPTDGSFTSPGSNNGSPSTPSEGSEEGSEEGSPLSTSAPSVMGPLTTTEGGQTPTHASPSSVSSGASPTASEPPPSTSPTALEETTVISDSNNNGVDPPQVGEEEGDSDTVPESGNDGNEEISAPMSTPGVTPGVTNGEPIVTTQPTNNNGSASVIGNDDNEEVTSPVSTPAMTDGPIATTQPSTNSVNSVPSENDDENDLIGGGDSDGDSEDDNVTPSSSPPTPALVFSPTVAIPNSPTGATESENIPTLPTSSGFDSSNSPTVDGYGDFASASPSPSDPSVLEDGESPSSSTIAQNPTVGENDNSSTASASPKPPTGGGDVGKDSDTPLTTGIDDSSPSSPTVSSPAAPPTMTPTLESLSSSPAPTFDSPDTSTTISPTVDIPSSPSFSPSVASLDTSPTANVYDGNTSIGDSPSAEPPLDVPISEESDANPESSAESSTESFTSGSSTGDKSSTASTDTVIACDESTLAWPETIEFTYSLETVTSNVSVVDSIRRSTEQALSKDAANLLLPCGVRRLQSGSALGFEGVDYKPEDTNSFSARCDPDVDISNGCTVIDGILTVYVVQQTDFDLTKYYALTAIREALGLVDGQVTGLVKATYLGPDIVNPGAFNPTGIEADDIAQEPDNLSTSLVLFAVGGCAFAASVGLIYYLRRQSYSSSGAATQAARSDQQTGLTDRNHPLSPFSEMLPSAYRFDQDGQMSAILELDDESATPRSAIAISDSGFTIDEEGSSAISSLGDTASVNHNSVLGARKRQDESMDSLLELL